MSTTKKSPFVTLKEKGLLIPLIVAVAFLVVGILIGSAGNGNDSAQAVNAVATPAPTITVSAEPIIQTVSKDVVPQECLDALDDADQGFGYAADLSTEYSRAITAITNNDLTDAEDILNKINTLNSNLGELSPDYNGNKQLCRAAGE